MVSDIDKLDSLVLRATRDGDVAARRELIRLITPWLRREVDTWLDPALSRVVTADDVVQEVCGIEIVRDMTLFRRGGYEAFKAWARQVARRSFLDAARTARRELGRRAAGSLDEQATLHALLSETTLTPSRTVSTSETRLRVRAALERLPAHQRHVIEQYDIGGRSMAEVARTIGVSEGAARMRRARAIVVMEGSLRQSDFFTEVA